MKRRSFFKKASLTTITAAVAVGSGFATPAIAKGLKRWSMTTAWPKNFPGLGTAANYLAEKITKASNGRLEVKVYGAGEIVPAFDAMDAVASGTVEMGHGAPYYWKGKVPAAQFLAAMPFGLTATEQNAWLEFGGGQDLADKIYEQMGCKFFAAGNTGVQMGGWYNKEIKNIKDFAGLKIRMPGLGGEVLKSLGATVVNLPGGDLLPAMQSGTIDAMEWMGPYNDVAFGIHKVAKYYYYPGWHEPSTILDCFINKKAWDSLDKDLQEIVKLAARDTNQYAFNNICYQNAKFLQKLQQKYKITPRSFSAELLKSLKDKSKTVLADIAKQTELSRQVFDSVEAFKAVAINWANISELAYMQARL